LNTLGWTGLIQTKGYQTIQEFEQALVDNVYDVVILPINRSNGTLTAGLLSMLSSDDPVINPSNRSHPDLVAIL
jgi:hypothetical protein